VRASIETEPRSATPRFLAAVLLPVLLACGESSPPLPPWRAPTEPTSELAEYVYIADATGAVLGALAEGSWPSWSPDGRRIVFHRDGHVRVIGADGTGEVELAVGQWPTWSPDGARIAFATSEGISVMNADGSAARQLMSPALFAVHVESNGGVGKLSWSHRRSAHRLRRAVRLRGRFPAVIFAMNADGPDNTPRPATVGTRPSRRGRPMDRDSSTGALGAASRSSSASED
jgi:hypothetical protein